MSTQRPQLLNMLSLALPQDLVQHILCFMRLSEAKKWFEADDRLQRTIYERNTGPDASYYWKRYERLFRQYVYNFPEDDPPFENKMAYAVLWECVACDNMDVDANEMLYGGIGRLVELVKNDRSLEQKIVDRDIEFINSACDDAYYSVVKYKKIPHPEYASEQKGYRAYHTDLSDIYERLEKDEIHIDIVVRHHFGSFLARMCELDVPLFTKYAKRYINDCVAQYLYERLTIYPIGDRYQKLDLLIPLAPGPTWPYGYNQEMYAYLVDKISIDCPVAYSGQEAFGIVLSSGDFPMIEKFLSLGAKLTDVDLCFIRTHDPRRAKMANILLHAENAVYSEDALLQMKKRVRDPEIEEIVYQIYGFEKVEYGVKADNDPDTEDESDTEFDTQDEI